MKIYLLTAISLNGGKVYRTKPMAFEEKEDALVMMEKRIIIDLLNLSDFREDMDIYQQEDFMNNFLKGNFAVFNEYEVMFNKNTLTYTRMFPYNGSTYEMCIEEVYINQC
jgi:hypothetical protein